MAYLYGRLDRFYCAKQTAYGTIRNTEGVASLAATDACKHISFSATPSRGRIQASDKESGAALVYIDRSRAGRMSGTASVSMPLFSGSGAGVAPDCGPILESAFGKEEIAAGASVTYSRLPSGLVTCELWGFNAGGKRGVCAYGSLVNRLTITGGQDSANLSADFLSYYVLGQDRFANASAAEKGGLTAWPNEPATQTYTGAELTGFTGTFTIDGQAYTAVRDFTITMSMNRDYDRMRYANDGTEFFPQNPFELTPEITLDFSMWSTDAASIDALLGKIANRTPVDATIVIGATAGGIYTFTLNNLIVPDDREGFTHEDGDDRKVLNFTGLRAQASNTSSTDEIGLVIT
jgi:hypothetical protein